MFLLLKHNNCFILLWAHFCYLHLSCKLEWDHTSSNYVEFYDTNFQSWRLNSIEYDKSCLLNTNTNWVYLFVSPDYKFKSKISAHTLKYICKLYYVPYIYGNNLFLAKSTKSGHSPNKRAKRVRSKNVPPRLLCCWHSVFAFAWYLQCMCTSIEKISMHLYVYSLYACVLYLCVCDSESLRTTKNVRRNIWNENLLDTCARLLWIVDEMCMCINHVNNKPIICKNYLKLQVKTYFIDKGTMM